MMIDLAALREQDRAGQGSNRRQRKESETENRETGSTEISEI